MFTYTYTLTDQEYANYTDLFVFQDKSIRMKGLLFMYGLPVLGSICMFLLHVKNWYFYGIWLLSSCAWIWFAKRIFPKLITKIVKEHCRAQSSFQEMKVSITQRHIEVAVQGETQQFHLQRYMFCKDLMILLTQQHEYILVPVRIIQQDIQKLLPLLEQMQAV